jgi:GNAT superfamily N-acetyltransferase
MAITTRLATSNDIPVLQQLIAESARGLSAGYYTKTQIESAIQYIFGVDTQLVLDGTYYVAEAGDEIIACGGWSKRHTLFGGDQHKAADPLLNPITDAGRIRAFFVHPAWARQGIGRMMINLCETEAIKNGFTSIEIGATLPGEPLYAAQGYTSVEKIIAAMPNGEQMDVIKMRKDLNLPKNPIK